MARSKKSSSPEPAEDFDAFVDEMDEEDLDLEEDVPPEDIEDLDFDAEIDEAEIEEDVEVIAEEEEEEEKEDVEEDEEVDYDVEEREPTLDEILKERSGIVEPEEVEEEEEEEEAEEDEENDSLTRRVLLGEKGEIGEDEFVCKSCFLVKHKSQLADPRRQLCRDCI